MKNILLLFIYIISLTSKVMCNNITTFEYNNFIVRLYTLNNMIPKRLKSTSKSKLTLEMAGQKPFRVNTIDTKIEQGSFFYIKKGNEPNRIIVSYKNLSADNFDKIIIDTENCKII